MSINTSVHAARVEKSVTDCGVSVSVNCMRVLPLQPLPFSFAQRTGMPTSGRLARTSTNYAMHDVSHVRARAFVACVLDSASALYHPASFGSSFNTASASRSNRTWPCQHTHSMYKPVRASMHQKSAACDLLAYRLTYVLDPCCPSHQCTATSAHSESGSDRSMHLRWSRWRSRRCAPAQRCILERRERRGAMR